MQRMFTLLAVLAMTAATVVGCKGSASDSPARQPASQSSAPSTTATAGPASETGAPSSQPEASEPQPTAETPEASATGLLRSMGSALVEAAAETNSQPNR